MIFFTLKKNKNTSYDSDQVYRTLIIEFETFKLTKKENTFQWDWKHVEEIKRSFVLFNVQLSWAQLD